MEQVRRHGQVGTINITPLRLPWISVRMEIGQDKLCERSQVHLGERAHTNANTHTHTLITNYTEMKGDNTVHRKYFYGPNSKGKPLRRWKGRVKEYMCERGTAIEGEG